MRSTSPFVSLVLATSFTLAGLAPRAANASDATIVYVNANPDKSTNAVAAFVIDAGGHASPVAGAPFATGGNGLAPVAGAEFAHRIEVARARDLLFAANDGSGTISVFNVNPITGALAAVIGSPFSPGAGTSFSGISLAASNDGRFLYASGSVVVSFFIDDHGGLNELGSEWAFSQGVAGIAVNSDNSRLFLSTANGVTILRTGEGGLTATPPEFITIGTTASDLRVNHDGSRIWVGTTGGGIQAYNYGVAGASLVLGTPFFFGMGNLGGLALADDTQSLFAYSPGGPRLLGAHVNTDGSLALGPGSPLTPAFAATGAALSPDGTRLMLADSLGQFDAWTAASDGSLAHLTGYPLLTGAAPGSPSVVTFPKTTPVPATPSALFVALAAILLFAGVVQLRPRRTRRPPRAPIET